MVEPEQTICVELVATLGSEIRTPVFSGAVEHLQMAASYNLRKSGQSWTSRRTARKRALEFLRMRGPEGLGQAQMAVSIATPDTPAAAGQQTSSGLADYVRRMSRSSLAGLKSLLVRPENQDASECHLNSFLTFISLSWETLVECILDRPCPPTFETVSADTVTASVVGKTSPERNELCSS